MTIKLHLYTYGYVKTKKRMKLKCRDIYPVCISSHAATAVLLQVLLQIKRVEIHLLGEIRTDHNILLQADPGLNLSCCFFISWFCQVIFSQTLKQKLVYRNHLLCFEICNKAIQQTTADQPCCSKLLPSDQKYCCPNDPSTR